MVARNSFGGPFGVASSCSLVVPFALVECERFPLQSRKVRPHLQKSAALILQGVFVSLSDFGGVFGGILYLKHDLQPRTVSSCMLLSQHALKTRGD